MGKLELRKLRTQPEIGSWWIPQTSPSVTSLLRCQAAWSPATPRLDSSSHHWNPRIQLFNHPIPLHFDLNSWAVEHYLQTATHKNHSINTQKAISKTIRKRTSISSSASLLCIPQCKRSRKSSLSHPFDVPPNVNATNLERFLAPNFGNMPG